MPRHACAPTSTLAADDVDVLLARLVDKSLVAAERQPGTCRASACCALSPNTAARRLDDAGETAMIRTRHTRWLIDLTAGVTTGSSRRGPVAWARISPTSSSPTSFAPATGVSARVIPSTRCRSGSTSAGTRSSSANVQNDEPVMLQLLELAATTPPAALRCRALMWSGLLSIGRTAKRTWAMDAVDVARTAASAG